MPAVHHRAEEGQVLGIVGRGHLERRDARALAALGVGLAQEHGERLGGDQRLVPRDLDRAAPQGGAVRAAQPAHRHPAGAACAGDRGLQDLIRRHGTGDVRRLAGHGVDLAGSFREDPLERGETALQSPAHGEREERAVLILHVQPRRQHRDMERRLSRQNAEPEPDRRGDPGEKEDGEQEPALMA